MNCTRCNHPEFDHKVTLLGIICRGKTHVYSEELCRCTEYVAPVKEEEKTA